MKRLSGPLAESLRRGRERFNTAFFIARQSVPNLDEAVFAEHLSLLAPAAEAASKNGPDRLDAVVTALYDLSLELLAKGILTDPGRSGLVRRVCGELLPALDAFLVEAPHETAGMLVNAVLQIAGTPGARPGDWMDRLIPLAPLVSGRNELFDAGRVLAWRSGMAHLRPAALGAAERLSDRVAFEALGLPQKRAGRKSAAELIRAIAADPWLDPARAGEGSAGRPKALRIVAEAGGFRGFGGPFLTPPRAGVADGRLVLNDSAAAWRLHADVFGTVFTKITDDIQIDAPSGRRAEKLLRDEAHEIVVAWKGATAAEGSITWGGATLPSARIAYPASLACDGTTLAITLRHSHRVLLVARTDGGDDEPA